MIDWILLQVLLHVKSQRERRIEPMLESRKDRNRIRQKEARMALWDKIIIPLLAIIVPVVMTLVSMYLQH